jgi:hypothetical protein
MSKYAKPLNSAVIKLGNGEEAKAENLLIKSTGEEELRFSWWTQDGKQFQRTPLDLKEEDWLRLFDEAVKNQVLSKEFMKKLKEILENGL